MRFSGKAVIVTGAGRGIAKGIAQRFAEEGADVVALDVDADVLEETAAEFQESGWALATVAGDVTKREDVQSAVSECVSRFGKLDVMVAAAGVIHLAHVLEIDDQSWQHVLDVNVNGVFYCTQEAARVMVANGGGSIIAIASINAHFAGNNNSSYCASKGAVVSFVRGAALDLGPQGVRVNAVNPGLTNTRIGGIVVEDPVMGPAYLQGNPIKRFAEPADTANAVLFLASDEASYMTGSEVTVDGGFSTGTSFVPQEARA